MGATDIEWATDVLNFLRGCSLCSQGCKNCYAMRQAIRMSGHGRPYQGLVRIGSNGPVWTGKITFDEDKLTDPLRWRKPRRIFVNSMSDLFHEDVQWDWFYRAMSVMLNANQHIYMILTKHPEKMARWVMSRDIEHMIFGRKTDHIWWGTSVENQATANERIPDLLNIDWGKRWVSAEPLLGPVDFTMIPNRFSLAEGQKYLDALAGEAWECQDSDYYDICSIGTKIDWMVVGGESGFRSRPMLSDWAYNLRDQCVTAKIPFFFKQFGDWIDAGCSEFGRNHKGLVVLVDSETAELWPEDKPADGNSPIQTMKRIGKKAAGRLLAGREWSQYPA